jgi:hypothetical protein
MSVLCLKMSVDTDERLCMFVCDGHVSVYTDVWLRMFVCDSEPCMNASANVIFCLYTLASVFFNV